MTHECYSRDPEERREWTWNGVFIVVMSFSVIMQWGCIYKSLGVLLPTLTEQFTADVWHIGTIISVMAIATDIAGK